MPPDLYHICGKIFSGKTAGKQNPLRRLMQLKFGFRGGKDYLIL